MESKRILQTYNYWRKIKSLCLSSHGPKEVEHEEWMVCLMKLVDVHNHRPSTCQQNYYVATTLDVVWTCFLRNTSQSLLSIKNLKTSKFLLSLQAPHDIPYWTYWKLATSWINSGMEERNSKFIDVFSSLDTYVKYPSMPLLVWPTSMVPIWASLKTLQDVNMDY